LKRPRFWFDEPVEWPCEAATDPTTACMNTDSPVPPSMEHGATTPPTEKEDPATEEARHRASRRYTMQTKGPDGKWSVGIPSP
jgi:hypothetical protein